MSERLLSIEAYMRDAHDDTWQVLQGLDEVSAKEPVYGQEGAEWSVRDVVAHLADAESGLLGQVQRLLAGEVTVPEDFDLDRWNRSAVRRSRKHSLADLIHQIDASYQEALATLRSVDETSLDLAGRHSSGAILTVEGFFRRMADHRREHTRDLQAAIDAEGPA